MNLPETHPATGRLGLSAPGMVALAIVAASPLLPLLLAVLPAPLAYARLRYGAFNFGLVASLCAVLVASGGGTPGLFAVLAALVICGHSLGLSTLNGEPWDRAMLKATLVPVATVGALMGFYFMAEGINPFELAARGIDGSVERAAAMYGQVGMSQADIDAALPTVKVWMRVMADGMAAVSVYAMALTCVLSRALLVRQAVRDGLAKAPVEGEGLGRWTAPDHAVWGVIVPGFLMIPDAHALRLVAGNVLAVFALVYLFQGLGIVSYFLGRLKLPVLLKALIWFFVAVQPFLLFALWAAGLFDTWADFRKLRNKAGAAVS